MTDILMPNAAALVAAYLRANSGVNALVGERVYGQVPAEPVYPLLVVSRVGGTMRARYRLDAPRITTEAWADLDENIQNGTGNQQSYDAIAAARAALVEMSGLLDFVVEVEGEEVHLMAVVTGVDELLGPTPLPDPVTQRFRHLIEDAVYLHPSNT